MSDYNVVAERLLTQLGKLNVTVLSKRENGVTIRFNGNDKNVILYWNKWGVFFLAWGDHVREMGYAQQAMEGLRHIAWALGR